MSSSITVGRYYRAHILISINVDDSSFNHILQYLILRLIHSLPGLNCLFNRSLLSTLLMCGFQRSGVLWLSI